MSALDWIELWRKCRDDHAIMAAIHAGVELDGGFAPESSQRHLRMAARAELRLCEARRRWLAAHRDRNRGAA